MLKDNKKVYVDGVRGVMMTKRAVPCEKCGSYYPGDCATHGCKDVDNCPCDGCDVVRYWRDQNED